jgi:hypothetical protein
MAFLFPKLFPGCVATGGFGINLSLTDAMALYWKPVSLRVQGTCTDLFTGVIFTMDDTYTSVQTIGDLVCGSGLELIGPSALGFSIGPDALQQGELYMPSISVEFILRDIDGNGRICLIDTSTFYDTNGSLSFQNSSIPALFFNDDDPGAPHSGSGSFTIITPRTF